MPLQEYSGILGVKRALHLLRRATFAATKQDVDAFANLTPLQATTQLFRQTLPTPPSPLNPETGNEWVISGQMAPKQMDGELQEAFKKWFIGQMFAPGIPDTQKLAYSAREKLVYFLHTHFTTIQEKVGNSRSLYFQNALYRLFALDDMPAPQQPAPAPPLELNFKSLTVKVSVDNAMMALLDGNLNVNGSPNENYARELMELYSIGRGLEGSLPNTTEPGDYVVYKEQDVQSAARVLSGWTTNTEFNSLTDPNITLDIATGLPRAGVKGTKENASAHDNKPKTFSSRMGNAVVQPNPALLNNGNPTEESALDEILQLIDLIYSQEETAKNICRKLYRFFVYHTITQTIDDTIITSMVDTFKSSGYKIQPVVENLLRSQHFYDAAPGLSDDAFGGIIKSPLELVISTVRMLGSNVPDPATNLTEFYEYTGQILETINKQGMSFYQPYDVSGYNAYSQYPIYQRSWINVNYLTRRYDFIRTIVDPMSESKLKVDVYQFVKDNIPLATASNAKNLVIELCKYFLPATDNLTFDAAADDNAHITAERLLYFKESFLGKIDIDPDGAWNTRWSTGVGVVTAQEQLVRLFNHLLQSPEYQLH